MKVLNQITTNLTELVNSSTIQSIITYTIVNQLQRNTATLVSFQNNVAGIRDQFNTLRVLKRESELIHNLDTILCMEDFEAYIERQVNTIFGLTQQIVSRLEPRS